MAPAPLPSHSWAPGLLAAASLERPRGRIYLLAGSGSRSGKGAKKSTRRYEMCRTIYLFIKAFVFV